MILTTGMQAPDFSLNTETANTTVQLHALKGKKVVLFFYPKDNTPGCTKEACDFRDHFNAFQQAKVEVFGISKDNANSHTKFKEKYQLPFTLLVDADGAVCKAYGVLNQKKLFGNTFLGIERSTFFIDEKGIVQAIWRKVKVSEHVKEVLHEISTSN
ncbi:MAG TPA: thioredoxin-dependent thiol peroxidase [Gammaproteobacteria bacterium]|jgi:peroxiredoxin Q/BCP|nr:thioredoxin-dependent thiol peroxidase [Gammaproteobacteria bacterium]